MNMLRKLGRAAVLFTGGRPAEASHAAVASKVEDDHRSSAGAVAWPPRSEREEEDEFEGEGWGFWGDR